MDLATHPQLPALPADIEHNAAAPVGGEERRMQLMMALGFLIALGPGAALFLGWFVVWLGARHHFRVEDLHAYENEHGHLPVA